MNGVIAPDKVAPDMPVEMATKRVAVAPVARAGSRFDWLALGLAMAAAIALYVPILIGLAGSYTGGLVGRALFGSPWGFVSAVVVAALLVRVVDRGRLDRPPV